MLQRYLTQVDEADVRDYLKRTNYVEREIKAMLASHKQWPQHDGCHLVRKGGKYEQFEMERGQLFDTWSMSEKELRESIVMAIVSKIAS